MAIKLTNTGIIMPDGNLQTTKMDASTDHGKMIATDQWSSNGTWTKRAGVQKIHVMLVGAGGGGCGHCESGGAGGYSEKLIDVSGLSVGATIAVTVGSGGGGTGYHSGSGNGGTTSFGSYLSATGGKGANTNSSHTGGYSGVGSGGDINLYGGSGRSHGDQGQDRGGESYFGGSQPAGHHGGNYYRHYTEGTNHTPPGTGGNGEWTSHSRGGNGSNGICIVYNYN
jgi:hypothetical protein